MNETLIIDLVDNGTGQNDLLFSIPDLIGEAKFDSYYFSLAIEPVDAIGDLRNAVSQLLEYWRDKVNESSSGETLFLPIDFSDQYTGCLSVQNKNEELVLTYGFSHRAGWAVSPLDPGNYYREVSDFKASPEKHITVDKFSFISTLDKQIAKLRKAG